MKRIASSAAALFALIAVGSCGAAPPQVAFQYAEKRATLPNGLRLVVLPDKNTQMVQVDVRYEVGSNEDPEGKAGLAHLVEHMMFQHRFVENGPATFEMLPQIANGFNAYTIWEKTHYYLNGRAEDLDGFLRLEAARMAYGCKTLTDDEFQREREVVRNEIRTRGGDAGKLVFQDILNLAYPPHHPYRKEVGGDDKQLTHIVLQDVCQFMKDYYVPSRATVVVVGNVDVDEVGKKVNAYFGGIEKGNPKPRAKVSPVPEYKHETVVREYDTERSQVHVLWRMPPLNSKDWPSVQGLVTAMTSQVVRFRRDWDFAASVSGGLFGRELGPTYAPFYILSMELYDAKDADEALSYVWKATRSAHRFFEDGMYDSEVKNLIKAGFLTSLESVAARADRVADLVQFQKDVDFGSNEEYLIHDLQQIEKVSGGKMRDFIKGRLKKSNAKVLIIKSNKKGKRGDKRAGLKFSPKMHDKHVTPMVDANEALRPLPAPKTKSILSKAEHYTLGNGMKVILLPREGMPVVSAQLRFNVGSVHEPLNRAGLANVAGAFLSTPLDSNIGKTGVSIFGGGAGTDTTTFYGRGMEIYLEVIIKGLERLIKAGYVSQKAIESWQRQIKLRWESENYRRRRAFGFEMNKALYGADHPYTTTGVPTVASSKKIGRDAVMSFIRKHYRASNATLVVVGSFDPALAKKYISQNFGAWSKGKRDEPVSNKARDRSGPEYIGVVGKENPQTLLTIRYPAPSGIDGQYAARMVLSTMINQRMAKTRTVLGSTYGTYGGYSPSLGPAAYGMGGNVDSARAGESLKFMRDQIDKLRAGEDFNLDFARARRVVLRRLMASSGMTMQLAGQLGSSSTYGLPSDFSDTVVKMVAAVSPAQVKALIAAELRPEDEIVGAMADRATLEKLFPEAGINNFKLIEPK